MKHLLKGMAVTVIVIALMSCDLGEDDEEKGPVNWQSATTNPAFGVRNNTSQRLVAFKGSLGPKTILGGIPASAQNHLIKRDPKFFNETQDFSMVLITEEQYNKNKKNLQSLQNTPFTRVYVFYNHNYDGPMIYYEISGSLGDGGKLRIQNNSLYNVELRQNGVAGETIGYAPTGMGTVDLSLQTGNIDIYPVFKYFNRVRGTVSTIYPLNDSGNAWAEPRLIVAGELQTIDIGTILNTIKNAKPSLGAAWLVIRNQSAGAVQLTTGTTIVVNALGDSYVNTNKDLTFQVDMPSVGKSYQASTQISNYWVGPNSGGVNIKDSAGNTTFTLDTDKMYVVTVTGNANAGGLTATIDLENATDVEFDVTF